VTERTASRLKSGKGAEIQSKRGGRRPGAGRPPKNGVSRRALAAAGEVSERTIARLEEHIRLVEAYPSPALERWSRTLVLRLGVIFKAFSEEDRKKIVAFAVAEDTPREAVAFLEAKYQKPKCEPATRGSLAALEEAVSLLEDLRTLPDVGRSGDLEADLRECIEAERLAEEAMRYGEEIRARVRLERHFAAETA
jgi:hypothetical protein